MIIGNHLHQIFHSLFLYSDFMVKKKNKKIRTMYLELEAFRREQSVEEPEKGKWVCVEVERFIVVRKGEI